MTFDGGQLEKVQRRAEKNPSEVMNLYRED